MKTNFTLRDFFVYILVGIITFLGVVLLLYCKNPYSVKLSQFVLIEKVFSPLIIVFFISILYLIGHVVGFISYSFSIIGQVLIKIASNYKSKLISILLSSFFSLGILYNIKDKIDSVKQPLSFKNSNEFWTCCAKLQINGCYSPAEYWYVLNELFHSLFVTFLILSISSLCFSNLILFFLFFFLTVFSNFRAKMYAKQFIDTVDRCTKSLDIVS